jgi:hypothetical protein
MKNEPVAWMMKSNDPDYVSDYIMFKTPERKDKISHQAIPLYTHPAKTLTDEEIMDCIEDKTGYSFNACDEDLLDFARAILRKAQEK